MQQITEGAVNAGEPGPVCGELCTAGLTRPPMLTLAIAGLSAGAVARVAIEDTAAGDWSDAQPGVCFDFKGPIQPTSEVRKAVHGGELPALRIGRPHSKLRVNVLLLSPGATIALQAYVT